MDNKTAKSKLRELRDSLSKVLGEDNHLSSEEVTEQSQEAIANAREAGKQLKRSLLDRVKEIPVVQKVSELGTAGTVAVATASTAQVSIATDLTTVFVAEVANDVVEQRFEVPAFINNVIDFHVLNDWGQVVIAEKVAEVSEMASVSQPTSESSSSVGDSTPESSSSSQDTASDTPSETESQESEAETESTEQEVEENKSSEESKEGDSETESEDTQEQNQEQETETEQESQEKNSSSDQPKESKSPVKTTIENVETIDEIKPHQLVSSVQ